MACVILVKLSSSNNIEAASLATVVPHKFKAIPILAFFKEG